MRSTTVCEECGSRFYDDTSAMASLCPECAHVLYGYAACPHDFEPTGGDGRSCARCGWDGSRSEYIKSLPTGVRDD